VTNPPYNTAGTTIIDRKEVKMSEVEELESRVYNLPTEDFAKFRDWFLELENERWDNQIRSDFKAGKFNRLIEKTREEFEKPVAWAE